MCRVLPDDAKINRSHESVRGDRLFRDDLVYEKERLYDIWEKEVNYTGPRPWGKLFGLRAQENERRPTEPEAATTTPAE